MFAPYLLPLARQTLRRPSSAFAKAGSARRLGTTPVRLTTQRQRTPHPDEYRHLLQGLRRPPSIPETVRRMAQEKVELQKLITSVETLHFEYDDLAVMCDGEVVIGFTAVQVIDGEQLMKMSLPKSWKNLRCAIKLNRLARLCGMEDFAMDTSIMSLELQLGVGILSLVGASEGLGLAMEASGALAFEGGIAASLDASLLLVPEIALCATDLTIMAGAESVLIGAGVVDLWITWPLRCALLFRRMYNYIVHNEKYKETQAVNELLREYCRDLAEWNRDFNRLMRERQDLQRKAKERQRQRRMRWAVVVLLAALGFAGLRYTAPMHSELGSCRSDDGRPECIE